MPPGAWAAAIWLLACLARDSSEALTTFGKTNPSLPAPPKATPPPGRECTGQSECAGIQDTSCVRHPSDSKMRCLCGDNSSPVNGRCETKIKGLKHACMQNSECMEGMICGMPNSTNSAGANKATVSTTKLCICNEKDGFVDKEFYCSDGVIHRSLFPLTLIAVAVISWMRRDN